MLRAVADTHTIIWYLYNDTRLSPAARACIEEAAVTGDHIGISSITLAEMVYLVEKGRLDRAALTRLFTALEAADTVLVEIPFERPIAQAMTCIPYSAVPDLPDRIIAASAYHLGVPVLSRGHKIRTADLQTIW